MNDNIQVILADDHPLVRAGIRATLATDPGIEVVAEAEDGDAVLRLCDEAPPDVLLLDLSMPGTPSLEIINHLQRTQPHVKIVILTAYDNDAYVRGYVAAGAVGYILKDEGPESVVDAIHTAMQGGSWFSRPVVDKLLVSSTAPRQGTSGPRFTQREVDILKLVAQGWDNARIADHLHLAEQTVRNYSSRIYDKIGVTSRGEAIVWAREHGYSTA